MKTGKSGLVVMASLILIAACSNDQPSNLTEGNASEFPKIEVELEAIDRFNFLCADDRGGFAIDTREKRVWQVDSITDYETGIPLKNVSITSYRSGPQRLCTQARHIISADLVVAGATLNYEMKLCFLFENDNSNVFYPALEVILKDPRDPEFEEQIQYHCRNVATE